MTNGETFEVKLESLLGQTERLPYLFIGSGFSRRYLNLPDWEGLLRHFAEICLPGNPLAYMTFQHIAGTNNDLPKIAEAIEKKFNDKWYNEISNHQPNEIEAVKRAKASPFKCMVAIYLNSFKNLPSQGLLADELALFNRVAKHSISGIITTNYDCLLEQLLPDYDVYCNQNELLFSPLQDVYEIFKIHGSIKQPSTMVLTSTDYDIQDSKTAYLAAKLLTIFVEHPIVFLGYSVKDSDIKKILCAISQCLSENQLDILKSRIFFVDWEEGKKDNSIGELLYPFENNKYLPMTQLTVGNYKSVFSIIAKKQSLYELSILRRLKRDVYKVVLNNEEGAEKYLRVIDLEGSENSNIKIVAGVSRNDEQEYSRPSADDIYVDIVLNNKGYIADKIIDKSMEPLLKENSGYMPVYYYISNYKKSELPNYIKKFVISPITVESLFNTKTAKEAKLKGFISWNKFRSFYDEVGFEALKSFDKVNFKEIKTDELKTLLTKIINDLKGNIRISATYGSHKICETAIRKMIRLLDILLYKQNALDKFKV